MSAVFDLVWNVTREDFLWLQSRVWIVFVVFPTHAWIWHKAFFLIWVPSAGLLPRHAWRLQNTSGLVGILLKRTPASVGYRLLLVLFCVWRDTSASQWINSLHSVFTTQSLRWCHKRQKKKKKKGKKKEKLSKGWRTELFYRWRSVCHFGASFGSVLSHPCGQCKFVPILSDHPSSKGANRLWAYLWLWSLFLTNSLQSDSCHFWLHLYICSGEYFLLPGIEPFRDWI